MLAQLVGAQRLLFIFTCPSLLLNSDRIVCALISFSTEPCDGLSLLLAQGPRDFTHPLQSREGEDAFSICRIRLPFSVKPDFQDDDLQFDGIESTTAYVLRFEAFKRIISTPKKRSVV